MASTQPTIAAMLNLSLVKLRLFFWLSAHVVYENMLNLMTADTLINRFCEIIYYTGNSLLICVPQHFCPFNHSYCVLTS